MSGKRKSPKVIRLPTPKPRRDDRLMLAMLLDGAVMLAELEPALRKLARCREFSKTRCRYANLHPIQTMCEGCEVDRRLDDVLRTMREAVALAR